MTVIKGAAERVPKGFANMRSILIKASGSVALPIYQAVPHTGLKIAVPASAKDRLSHGDEHEQGEVTALVNSSLPPSGVWTPEPLALALTHLITPFGFPTDPQGAYRRTTRRGSAMDLWSLNLKSGGGLSIFGAARKHERSRLVALRRIAAGWTVLGREDAPAIYVSYSSRNWRLIWAPGQHRSIVVRASGEKNNHGSHPSSGKNDPSNSEEDGLHETASQFDKSKSNEYTKKSHHILSDWRNFRANLVAREQEQLLDSNSLTEGTTSHESSQRLGLKWAHPIPVPESGCVLVATEKLDGVPSFERTVILLLRLGSRDPRDGPFGIILNRPLHRKIKHMKPSNPDLATIFSDCSVHCGGPLEANMFLLRSGENVPLPGFEEVVSGVFFGSRNSLDEAAALVKRGIFRPKDFRFYVGYAGWQFDQLLHEVESNYWIVAACSAQLINGATSDSSSNLWEEILQLMGGQYSELSRKPKQDSP
ncbi:hypothetical protein Cni_G12345 [Canna indica]|uniref:Uncharacterized protein n=1 Tax=Canna indica TaxID=4628 RepID=A0AAQ3K827_9LILI|nr:hypothetical protein Cni_G12345 [Canna indica]